MIDGEPLILGSAEMLFELSGKLTFKSLPSPNLATCTRTYVPNAGID